MSNPQKSITWINSYKALCILAVFFVHCQLYYGYEIGMVNDFVHPWYVNAFFFVSGYLLLWKQLSAPRIEEDRALYVSRLGGGRFCLTTLYSG